MPIGALVQHVTDEGTAHSGVRRYLAPMTSTAHTVAEALTSRRPAMGSSRLHSLLYMCQGHHLADLSVPLFDEPIHATRAGAVVDIDEENLAGQPTFGQLNTIGYVISRYGNLSAADLRTLVQGSDPWQLARQSGDESRIEWAWLLDWFRRAADQAEPDEPRLSREQMAKLAARMAPAPARPGTVDTRESMLARLDAMKARAADAP